MDYEKYLNKNVITLEPSGIRKFFDVVAKVPGAISLGVGEPDFDTPWESREAAVKSIRKGYTHYTSNKGTPELRKAITDYYEKRFGLSYDSLSECIVTVGASEAIDLAVRSIVNAGEEVLIPSPSYVSYAPCVLLQGAVPVAVNCYEENDFRVTAKEIDKVATDKTKLLILPYPNNPSGAILEKGDLEKIAEVCVKRDLIVISDEIYGELTYNGKSHVSVASIKGMKERCIVINGFSKAFAMTGWRLGYALAPEPFIYQMYKIHQYTIMCAPTASQFAALESLNTGFKNGFAEVAEMRDQYDSRRKYVLNAIREMGLECFEPEGAFYLFPSVKSLGMTGAEFADKLFASKKVAVVPGAAFGECGKYNVRISYAYSIKNLTVALEKIAEFVKEIRG
ncbi:MAG: aminotransferase class I/II-fold pyridoxal phosphate-dependent enzyme [Clostridia bacterium]|nr:aminotransferase class I/II-fold pyridoxal phosphate-dependent enzyme [Clostridia bacterium]